MSNRIPPALKWLIDKRARLDSEVSYLEKEIKRVGQLAEEIQRLRTSMNLIRKLISELQESKINLAAIDRSLGLYHIQVDVQNISPVRTGSGRHIGLPYGLLNTWVLTRLRQVKGKALSTDEITSFVIHRASEIGLEPCEGAKARESVRYRLKQLAGAGVIERCSSIRRGSYDVATWRLPR